MTALDPELAALGQAVRRLREERDISRGAVAAVADLSVKRLRAIEDGLLDPDYMLLLALAKALGVSAGELVRRAAAETQDGDR
jgi:transcriptional regulator with XRE-family HTH domain